ncbi:MAG TPA: hypothetical protein VFK86_16045 [Bauldia sp.]|nr:hypothetical protein [Bauldia sp.]
MFKFLFSRRRRAEAARRLFEEARIASDPLGHPAFRTMSAAELADIPFPRPSESDRR